MDKFNKICLGIAVLSLISTTFLGFITWQQQNYIESLHKLTVIRLKHPRTGAVYEYTLRSVYKDLSDLDDRISDMESNISSIEDTTSKLEDSLTPFTPPNNYHQRIR